MSKGKKSGEGQVLGRKEITSEIYVRVDKSIKKKYIADAVNVICEEIGNALSRNESLSVKNFGTLNPYLFHSHAGFNVKKGEVDVYPEFWSVKFHAHASFEKLLAERKDRFSAKKS